MVLTSPIILEYPLFLIGRLMSQHFGLEQLHMTVYHLVGAGDVRSRLKDAVVNHFNQISIHNDLPHQLELDFAILVSELNKTGNEAHTLDSLTEDEAEEYAKKIVQLYEKAIPLIH